MIKAVIFDMDGVIIDSEMIYLKQLYKFVLERNPNATIEQLYPVVGFTAKDTWEVVAKVIDNGQKWDEIRQVYRSVDVYANLDYRTMFRQEVRDVLAWLKAYGYKLALASSTNIQLITRVVTENSIKNYFDVIVSGNQFKRSKPDPEIYHYTASQLGCTEEECFVVEDSTYGITAASLAGMTIAAMKDERFAFDQSLANYSITSVKEIMSILEGI